MSTYKPTYKPTPRTVTFLPFDNDMPSCGKLLSLPKYCTDNELTGKVGIVPIILIIKEKCEHMKFKKNAYVICCKSDMVTWHCIKASKMWDSAYKKYACYCMVDHENS